MSKPIEKIISVLKKRYGVQDLKLSNDNSTIFRLLIRTILAARNTDINALAAAKELFSKYKTPKQIAEAPLSNIKRRIKRGVFFNVKAKNIKKTCQILVKKYKGKVPRTMGELVQLPGIGRKTANIVLTYGHGKLGGIPVDTHVFRVVNRIGIVKEKTPLKTESALLKIVPRKFWYDINSLFVDHGRQVCNARKPKCVICPVKQWCDYYKKLHLGFKCPNNG